jgi:hypothetical protein
MEPAADQLLELDQREVRLDAGRVAVIMKRWCRGGEHRGFMRTATRPASSGLLAGQVQEAVGGGSMQIVNPDGARALKSLGYQGPSRSRPIVEFIAEHGHVVNAPSTAPEHYEVFDCAMGERAISPMGHVR